MCVCVWVCVSVWFIWKALRRSPGSSRLRQSTGESIARFTLGKVPKGLFGSRYNVFTGFTKRH